MIGQLAELCRTHLLTEKILVAPSLAIGHQIADAVAHSGTPWVNLRVETIRTLSDAVAGFALAREGVTVLSRAQALSIIERVCDRVLDSSTYFAALADRPGLHRAIQRSIEDLGHAGLTPADLKGESFEDRRKAEDIARVLAGYQEEMARGKFVDRLGVIRRATEMAKPRKDVIWLVIEDVELTQVEERFLQAAAGEWEVVRTFSPAKTGGEGILNVAFRKAIGEENEVRGAFRAILADAAPGTFDDAEIVYTTRDPYLPLIHELAAEYEVPCTFAEGIASYFTRPGQATLAYLRWIGEGWHASELRAFAGAHATVLRQAKIGWGRDRYLPRIDGLIAERKLAEKPTDRAEATREFIAALLEISKDVAEGDTLDVAVAARSAAAFVKKFATPRNEIDGMAHAGLVRLFEELAALPGAEAPRAEVARRLSEAARALHVSASNPRPGFLHVAPVRGGGWAARGRLFVVGLDESRHPGTGLQDPIVLDSEREAIGIPIVGDRPQRVTEQFRSLLARAASREVTLSYSSLALRDRRERFPSPAFVDVYREVTGRHDEKMEDIENGLVRETFVDPQPLSASEWWLLRRFVDGETSLREAILAAYPQLAAGAVAVAARDSAEITKWDGKISAPPEVLDPRRNGVLYSASQLEKMAACPYQHFLERILKVNVLDDIAYEPDTWLEAHHFGTLMHEVLQRTMEEICARGEKPAMASLARMKEIAEEELGKWRETIPPPSESAFDRRRTDLLEACEVFLRSEEEACRTVTPSHFEWGFDDFALPLGSGRSVKLRGRIDRIDRDEATGEWHVWDYKSGSTFQFEGGGRLNCGTKIQHAIYARAVESKLGGRVTKSGYYFPTAKGNGARLLRECADRELKDALNHLFDTIATGWFPHAGEDACKFCDFQEACEGPKLAAERTNRKLVNNDADAAVKAWLNLQEVK